MSRKTRLTLNKPATDVVLQGAAKACFLIDANVLISPTSKDFAENMVPVETTRRGGSVLQLNNDLGARILAVLEPTPASPFYELKLARDGWFCLSHKHGTPARHIPSLRVWFDEDSEDRWESMLTGDVFLKSMRFARKLVASSQHAMGRPTRDLLCARGLLEAFAFECKTLERLDAYPKPITESIDRLEDYLQSLTGQTRTADWDVGTIRAAVRAAESSDNPAVKDVLRDLILLTRLDAQKGR